MSLQKKEREEKREKEREREKGKQGKRSEIPMIGLRMTCPESLVLLEARGIFEMESEERNWGGVGKAQKF